MIVNPNSANNRGPTLSLSPLVPGSVTARTLVRVWRCEAFIRLRMDEAEALKLIIDITAQIAARAKMPVDIVVPLSAHEKFIFNSVNTQLGLPEDELSSFIVNTTDVYKRDGVQDWNDLAPDFVAVLIRLHAPSNLQKTTVTIRVMQEKSAMPQLPLDIALAGVR